MKNVCSFVVLILFACSAWAQPSQSPVEIKAQEMEKHLIAPCCWAKTLDQEQSEVAIYMKEKIRQRLAQGKPVEDIYQEFEEEFGERVFAEPQKAGFNMLVWIFPALALLLGAVLLYRKLLILKPQQPEDATPDDSDSEKADAEEGEDQKYIDQIDQELYRQ